MMCQCSTALAATREHPKCNTATSLTIRRASAPGWPRLSVQIAEVCAVMPVTGGAASPQPAQNQCLVAHIAFSESSQELWYLAVGSDDLHRPIKPELLRSLDLGSCIRVCPVTVRGAAGAWLEASTSMRLQGVTLRWMCRDRDATQSQILCLKPAQGRLLGGV